MKKVEFVSKLATKTGTTKKDTEGLVKAFLETITEELAKGGSVSFVGFGSFKAKLLKGRKGINPGTKKPINTADKMVPRFTAGKDLKTAVLG